MNSLLLNWIGAMLAIILTPVAVITVIVTIALAMEGWDKNSRKQKEDRHHGVD